MLDKNLLDAVFEYSKKMKQNVQLVMGQMPHPLGDELIQFLTQIAGATDKIDFNKDQTDASLSQASFKLVAQNQDTGVVFSGIPSGHEFSSFILAVLQAGGHKPKLDDDIIAIIKQIDAPLSFQTFVSLSCHNCPDVVQSLNQFALLNKHITNEMIDGAHFADLVDKYGIQGVPAVFLNGKPFANGKIDTAKIIEKLQQYHPNILQTVDEDLPNQDVTVIGGGPAGAASAIYTARKGLKVALITDRIGGQVKDTQDIENLISVPLTTGPALAANLQTHLESYNIILKQHISVSSIDEVDGGYTIHLSTGIKFFTRSIIVATGAKWRKLGVKGEDENIGNGVAYCPHCDGPFFKGKDVAVVGGGNSGIEAALDLAQIVRHVTVLEFADQLRADKVLVDKALQQGNIDIIKSAATNEITTDGKKVNALIYTDRHTNTSKTLPLSAVFVQIGLVPNSELFKDLLQTTKHGEIVIDEKCQTSKKGIFACGDVTTVPYKQINIAMGEGSKAGLAAFEYLMFAD